MSLQVKLGTALWLLLGLWLAAAGTASAATVDPALEIPVGGTADAIVITVNAATTYDTGCVALNGGTVKQVYPQKSFSAVVTSAAVNCLSGAPSVSAVIADKVVKASGTLDVARATMGFASSPYKAEAAGVAVIDSGVTVTNKIGANIVFKDYVAGKTTPYDDNGHGTHIAGILASQLGDTSQGFLAKILLIAIKVLAADGSGKMSHVIDAINWAVANKATYNIKVINLSLGTPVVLPWYQDPLAQAAEWAWNNGVVVVVSAGNSGPNPGTITSPGNDPLVITVGATDDLNTNSTADDTMATFSSRGDSTDPFRKPDVVTPGTRVISLLAPNSYLAVNYPSLVVGADFIKLSGTSMAAPMAAAEAAQILNSRPNLTPNQVKNVMLYTAKNLGQNVYAQGYGYGNYAAAKSYIKGLGEWPETKISKVNPGLVGTTMATGDGLTGKLVYDWLMQDGVLVDDQLIRWLRDTRGVEEFLVFWLRDHGLLNQNLIYYLGNNPNLTPDNIEPQLVRWSFANAYFTTTNVDQMLIRWMIGSPAVQSELAYWLSNLSPVVNQQLIWYLTERGVDGTLITWLTTGGYVDGTLIKWLADHYFLSSIDLNSELVRWSTVVDGRMNNATVNGVLVRWLGTSTALYTPIQANYDVWKTLYP